MGSAEVAAPPPLPPALPWRRAPGVLWGMLRDRPSLMSRLATGHDAVRLRLGPQQLFYFTRPEHAHHVLALNATNYEKGIGQSHARRALGRGLLTNEGQAWSRARAELRPAFSQQRLPQQTEIIDCEAVALVHRLRLLIDEGRPTTDVQASLTDFTIRVLGAALVGRDLTAYTELSAAFDVVQDQAVYEMTTLNAVPTWVPTRRQRRFRSTLAYLDEVVDDLITQRRCQGGQPDGHGNDLVSLLLTSTTSEPEVRRRLRDELVTMLLAGHETTASSLAWAVYQVGRHPEVRERIRHEAIHALGSQPCSGEDAERAIRELPYTAAVIHEVTRLHPAVWLLSRKALSEDRVGDFRVPAGAQVLICPYALHRDPRFWEAPEEFRPERFLGGFPAKLRYAYIPFGAGPRSCVGRSLGLTEIMVAVARICRDLDFTLEAHDGRSRALLTLRPAGGLGLRACSGTEPGPSSPESGVA